MVSKIIVSTFVTALALGFAAPVMAASDKGIDCLDPGIVSPGQGAKTLSEASQEGNNPFQPGIGNLAKSFPDDSAFQQPPVLMNTFCTIGNGKGKGPGHEEPS